jgi:hypothetical protein
MGASVSAFRIKGTRIGVMIIKNFRGTTDYNFALEVSDSLKYMTAEDNIFTEDEFKGISCVTHLIIDVRSIGASGMGNDVGYGG